jgi:nitrate reductase gamma subunit
MFANSSYLSYILFSLGLASPAAWEDTGFQIKFFETIFLAITYIFGAVYLAVMTVLKFPVIEFGKDLKSKKHESEDSDEK